MWEFNSKEMFKDIFYDHDNSNLPNDDQMMEKLL